MIVYIYINGANSGVIRTWLEVAEDYPSAVLRTDTPEGETETETGRARNIYTSMVRDSERQGQGKRCMIIIVYEEHILGKNC